MPNLLDVFSDDAFSLVALTDSLSKIDHVPGQAGELGSVLKLASSIANLPLKKWLGSKLPVASLVSSFCFLSVKR